MPLVPLRYARKRDDVGIVPYGFVPPRYVPAKKFLSDSIFLVIVVDLCYYENTTQQKEVVE